MECTIGVPGVYGGLEECICGFKGLCRVNHVSGKECKGRVLGGSREYDRVGSKV